MPYIVTESNKIKSCADVYQWARSYIKNFNVAVDVGCRQGYFALNLGAYQPRNMDFLLIKQ
jgi:hypothetical protein